MSYKGSFNPSQKNNSRTAGNYQSSNTDKYIDTRMNNLSLQYNSGFGLNIGEDYTRYTLNNEQDLNVIYKNDSQSYSKDKNYLLLFLKQMASTRGINSFNRRKIKDPCN